MKELNTDHRIFRQAATRGKIADVDGTNDAIKTLFNLYRALGVPRRDAHRVTERLRYSIESGKAHNQAKRGERLKQLLNDLQDFIK